MRMPPWRRGSLQTKPHSDMKEMTMPALLGDSMEYLGRQPEVDPDSGEINIISVYKKSKEYEKDNFQREPRN